MDSAADLGQSKGRTAVAQEMDELIQANELLLKENDFLQTFVQRFAAEEREQEEQELAEEAAAGPGAPVPERSQQLSLGQRLSVALFEVAQLERDRAAQQQRFQEYAVEQKAAILAGEQRLSALRRLMFQFQREVLNDQQIANQFVLNEEGVEQVVHRMPRQVLASALQQFYERQSGALTALAEQARAQQKQLRDQLAQLERARAKNARQSQLSQIDFEQLKIENDKQQDKVATRNQEMLRIKLSAGTCMRWLNDLKAELARTIEQKRGYDREVGRKENEIKELDEKIRATRAENERNYKTLQVLRQKEIFAHDGPQSIDYLSIKVNQQTLERAVREMQRKIQIKRREISSQSGRPK